MDTPLCPRCNKPASREDLPWIWSCFIHGEFYIQTEAVRKGLRKDPLMQERKLKEKRMRDAEIKRKQRKESRELGRCYDCKKQASKDSVRCRWCTAKRRKRQRLARASKQPASVA